MVCLFVCVCACMCVKVEFFCSCTQVSGTQRQTVQVESELHSEQQEPCYGGEGLGGGGLMKAVKH